MSAHTPGPWTWNNYDTMRGANGRIVFQHSEHQGEPPSQADARLIATAPELLAVAKTCAESLERCEVCGHYPHATGCVLIAAIAKAEGC